VNIDVPYWRFSNTSHFLESNHSSIVDTQAMCTFISKGFARDNGTESTMYITRLCPLQKISGGLESPPSFNHSKTAMRPICDCENF